MEPTKKDYVKPEMTVVDVKMELILAASNYPLGPSWPGNFD